MTEGFSEAENGWFIGPRISFSTDFAELGIDKVSSPLREEGNSSRPSTEFEFSMTIESPVHGAPADEIFFNGKLLPLSKIQVVKEVLNTDTGDTKENTESTTVESSTQVTVCHGNSSSPHGSSSSPSTPRAPTCTGNWKELLGRISGSSTRSIRQLKFVRLFFKRASEDFVKTRVVRVSSDPKNESTSGGSDEQVQVQDTDDKLSSSSGTLEHGEEKAEADPHSSSDNPTSDSASNSAPAMIRNNSGRILLKNLERCSRNCAKAAPEQGKICQQRDGCKQVGEKSAAGSFSSSVRVAPVPMCLDPVKETRTTMTGFRKMLMGKKTGGNLHRVSWTCPGSAL